MTMRTRALLWLRTLLAVAMIAGTFAGLAASWSGSPSVALASVAADSNDNDEDDRTNEDTDLRGQVVSPGDGRPGIDRDAQPYPLMYVANIDGVVTVEFIGGRKALDESGVKEGDTVSVDGNKVDTFFFQGTNLEVKERYGGR
jgi:hypothetical protein